MKYVTLKALREEAGLTQLELSKKLKTSQGYYSEVENGRKPGSLDFWLAVSFFFDIDLRYIVM